jgi:hypothetical protein
MESVQAIDITPTEEIEQKALAIPDMAHMIIVEDNLSMQMADNTRDAIKAMIKEVDTFFKPMADKAFQAHRAITGKWKETTQPLKDADLYLERQVKSYLAEVKRIADLDAARIREEQRKIEEERILREAAEAEAQGNTQEAEAIINEPVYVPYVPPVVTTPKVDNRRYRTIPRAKVIDKGALVRYVAAHPALLDLIDINQSVINTKAKALGKEINNIPGLSYYEE